jgi:hypothetical protein
VPCVRVVVATREKSYVTREKIYPPRKDATGENKKKWRKDPGGNGREIAREARACPRCASNSRMS